MPNPMVHFELPTRDPAKSHKFYGDLFGWKIKAIPQIDYGLIDTDVKGGIGGGITKTSGQPTDRVTFYVEVDDLNAYLRKAARMEAKIVVPVTVVPKMVTFAVFSDADGNMIGLVKAEPPR
ncbi:MAG: VOC family protein [Dehalococcoidia bacterium]|nr:VOC family protein [Dehalococcoidia bacterium]